MMEGAEAATETRTSAGARQDVGGGGEAPLMVSGGEEDDSVRDSEGSKDLG